jgi:hypothetical protein
MAQNNRPLTSYNTEELVNLLQKPEEYGAFSDDELWRYVYLMIGAYGATRWTGFIPLLMRLYALFVERIGADQRLETYSLTCDAVTRGEATVDALTPYLMADHDVMVVSTAALDYALLQRLDSGDCLTGPKCVLNMVRTGAVSNAAAAVGGLVMLGDQRVMELVKGLRHSLSRDEVETITQCWSGYLYSATIEFIVSWLEDLDGDYDDAIFGNLAAYLCRLVCDAREPLVQSIERVFPSTRENCIHILNAWPIEEYATLLAPRLQKIARKENEPRVMQHVLEAWGVS